MTVVNALSDIFILESYRQEEGYVHRLEFHEGELVKDTTKKLKKSDKQHGTIVKFRPSKKYMGEECDLPVEDVISWIEDLFYLNSKKLESKKIKCKFTTYDKIKVVDTYKFKPKEFNELLKKSIPANVKKKELSSLFDVSGDTSFEELSKTLVEDKHGKNNVEMVETKKNIHMDVSLIYSVSPDFNNPATYDTYCNYTHTIENGVHLVAFDETYCRYMQSKINDTMSDAQKDKLKVTWDDIRTNLFCVINLSSNAAVGFVGNQKKEIGNKDLIPYMKDLLSNLIDDFFNDNPDILNEYIKIIKLNAKARIEAAKAKTASKTERMNTFAEHSIKSFIRCNNTGKQWKELFICEGDSAGGGIRNGSDPDTQAVFLLRGVVFVKAPLVSNY